MNCYKRAHSNVGTRAPNKLHHHEIIAIIYLFLKFHLFASLHICIFFMHVKKPLFVNSINFNNVFSKIDITLLNLLSSGKLFILL